MKKTLKEVFEFFPDAKWITEDKFSYSIHMTKPYFNEVEAWDSSDGSECGQADIEHGFIGIDFSHIDSRKNRCVSREEIMGRLEGQ